MADQVTITYTVPQRPDCGVIVTASCGCAFRCLHPSGHSGNKHCGPFVNRCARHG